MPEPDLLDFIPYQDGGRLGAPPDEPGPSQCCWCHRAEPNGVLLRNNHMPDSQRATATTWCVAMELTLNHVLYWEKVIDGEFPHPIERRKPVDAHAAQARDVLRAEAVWANRLDDFRAALLCAGVRTTQREETAMLEQERAEFPPRVGAGEPSAPALYDEYVVRAQTIRDPLERLEHQAMLGVDGHSPQNQAQRHARAQLVMEESSRRVNAAYERAVWPSEPQLPDDTMVFLVERADGDVRALSLDDLHECTVQAFNAAGRSEYYNDEDGQRWEWVNPMTHDPELARDVLEGAREISRRLGIRPEDFERVPERLPRASIAPPSLGHDVGRSPELPF